MYLFKVRLLLIGILLVLINVVPAAAITVPPVTLTVGTDIGEVSDTLILPVTVNEADKIAGAAFTIVYDASALTVEVSSEFFDTFYAQFDPLATTGPPNPDGGEFGEIGDGISVFPVLDDQGAETGDVISIPAVVESEEYYQPLIANPGTSGLMIAAARCVPGPAGPAELFSLTVELKAGQNPGIYPIQINPTELNNTAAGYDAGGETIDLLIGSDAAAFPVILDDEGYESSVVDGQVEFTVADSDNDGLSDAIENSGCTDFDDADTDDDGISDGAEDANQNGALDAGETDPCLADSDYDGILDGTESGLTLGDVGPDTDLAIFVPDADPSTKTDPTKWDTDGDGLSDGQEDSNKNGRVDPGETDPNPRKVLPFIPLLLLGD